MDNACRAVRQFERLVPGLAYQEYLRTTDSRRYRQYMNARRTQINPQNSSLIAIIVYDHDAETVRIEGVNRSKEN